MSKNKTRKSLAQIKMVQQGYLTMYGCKDKLCLDAEVTLVISRHPKMLAAYTHKLHPLAEKKMVETGQHQMLKEYRFELEEENQILLVLSERPKLLAAYRHKLCPKAEKLLRKMHNPRLNRVYGYF